MMVTKFRAYIKNLDEFEYDDVPQKRHFVYGNLIKGEPNGDVDAIVGDLIEVTNEYVDPKWWCFIKKGSAEQFTGLKDNNGREIYEGDILQPVLSYTKRDIGKPFEVKKGNYVYGKWIAKDVSSKGFGVDGYYFSNEMRLVGNTHTNPELLEEK